MIKANELRVGNWIQRKHTGTIVQMNLSEFACMQFGESLKETIEPDRTVGEEYEPIPVTEEWLLKFGFEKVKNVDDFSIWATPVGSPVLFTIQTDNWSIHMNEEVLCNTQYVHQLQNLYFALTGEELTIKQAATV